MRTNTLATSNPQQPWEHFARAATAHATGDHRAALHVLQQLTERWPTLPSGWSQLATLLLANGTPNTALLAALRGIAIDPHHVESLTRAGDAARALGQTTDAIAYFSTATELNLHAPTVHDALIALHVERGDAERAATAGAQLIACCACTTSDTITSVRRIEGCRMLARLQLPPGAASEAHALIAAARAIATHRTITAIAALNRIRTAMSAPEYDTAARVLMAKLLRTRRIPRHT